jgi:HSP20 family protein
MNQPSLIPTFMRRSPLGLSTSFADLQREMDRMFDVFGPVQTGAATDNGQFRPALDISETKDALDITAELPGVDSKDASVTLAGDLLTVRGEKKAEREEKDKDWHLVERSYGSFVRTMRLPFTTDPGLVEARFDKGVLMIHIPKPAEVKDETRQIEIRS